MATTPKNQAAAAPKDDATGLTLLGKSGTAYPQRADSSILETFPNAHPGRAYTVTFETAEFTSLCPITGQPDFGVIRVRYAPGKTCLESKSLKIYLFSYRSEPAFMETLTNRILDDLWAACEPVEMTVTGEFAARGGVRITVEASRRADRGGPAGSR
ncbi:MAG: NADPH-dependent 7-cyano-7-deazaguanine reductase QueF [Desulfovibrionaceae bacterium]|nr:NADPH-dependent 7-cyano-7-deazaguanine reductase QueF [Desulfovibrionaceae bacterium]MBF0512810.1 NADPH-dependent 7-cyano-7-deazaguanine reductase QueF [Desulfovibrionaceae bacterium]